MYHYLNGQITKYLLSQVKVYFIAIDVHFEQLKVLSE